MTMLWRLMPVILLGIWNTTPVDAKSPEGFQIYPFPAVIVNSEITTPEGVVSNALVSEEWQKLYQSQIVRFNDGFVAAITQAFPEQITEKILKSDRNRSLVASLHIVRARHYSVSKPNGTQDVYVPVTGSIYFTNPLTAEVAIALSLTVKPIQTLATNDPQFENRLTELYETAFVGLQEALIKQAKERFRPEVIEAVIVDTPFGLAHTSLGNDGGLGQGDILLPEDGSPPLKLIACDNAGCVGKRNVGLIQKGDRFVKRSTGKLKSLDKPSVFVTVSAPDLALSTVWGQIFSENLGEKSPFNVVYVNPDFQYLITGIAQRNEISYSDILNRDPPELVLHITIDPFVSHRLPTNLSYQSLVGVTGRATAKVVDRKGNVVFTSTFVDQIDDEVTANIDFDIQDRAEVSTKNVLIGLAEKITKEYQPATLEFALQKTGSGLGVEDPNRILRSNKNYIAYRPIKLGSSGIPTLVPIANVRTEPANGTRKGIRSVGGGLTPQKVDIMAGDKVVVKSAVSKTVRGDSTIGICGPSDDRGSLILANVHEKVFSGMANAMPLPFIDRDAADALQFMLRGESGFAKSDDEGAVDDVLPDFCLHVIQKVDVAPVTCTKSICQVPISLKLGTAIKRDGASLAQKAIEQKLVTIGFHESATEAQRMSVATSYAERNLDLAIESLLKVAQPALESAIQQALNDK